MGLRNVGASTLGPGWGMEHPGGWHRVSETEQNEEKGWQALRNKVLAPQRVRGRQQGEGGPTWRSKRLQEMWGSAYSKLNSAIHALTCVHYVIQPL